MEQESLSTMTNEHEAEPVNAQLSKRAQVNAWFRNLVLTRRFVGWACAIVIGIPIAIYVVSRLYVFIGPPDSDSRGEFVRTIAQALGGTALLGGLYFTWRTVEATRANLDIARETLEATKQQAKEDQVLRDRELQIALDQAKAAENDARETRSLTQEHNRQIIWAQSEETRSRERIANAQALNEQFYQATQMLGSRSEDSRIGALYALERISKEYYLPKEHYWQCIELICAFVRRRSREFDSVATSLHYDSLPESPEDIRTALTILARRRKKLGDGEYYGLDLNGAYIVNVPLENGDFQGAKLRRITVVKSIMKNVNFSNANFASSRVSTAFIDCPFVFTSFYNVDFSTSAFILNEPKHLEHTIARDTHNSDDAARWTRPNGDEQWLGIEDNEYLAHSLWDGVTVDELTITLEDLSNVRRMSKEVWKRITKSQDATPPYELTDEVYPPTRRAWDVQPPTPL